MNKEQRKKYYKKWRKENPEYFKKWYKKNSKKHKENTKRWRKENPEYYKKWRKENPEKVKENAKKGYKKWYKKNPEIAKKRSRKWYKTNLKKAKENNKKWRKENREKRNENERNRKKIDIQYKLACNLRTRLNIAIKNNQKVGSAIKDLGCSIDYFKKYFEKQFTNNMNWDNYGEWHIDHQIPLSVVDLTDREELKNVCHYTNLQPMWADENIKKSNLIIK